MCVCGGAGAQPGHYSVGLLWVRATERMVVVVCGVVVVGGWGSPTRIHSSARVPVRLLGIEGLMSGGGPASGAGEPTPLRAGGSRRVGCGGGYTTAAQLGPTLLRHAYAAGSTVEAAACGGARRARTHLVSPGRWQRRSLAPPW